LPFSLASCLFSLVVAMATVLAITGSLDVGTERWYFLLYVAVTLLVVAGISVLPRLAWCVLTLAMLELAVGVTTHMLAMAGLGRSLFPENIERRARWLYHPMLQITPVPNFVATGTARSVRHNDYGLRGAPIPEAKRAEAIVVAVLGGSTTYESQL